MISTRGRTLAMLTAALAITDMTLCANGLKKQPKQEPVDKGRRAEKDAIALAKAEAKRKRRAEKRARSVTPSIEDDVAICIPRRRTAITGFVQRSGKNNGHKHYASDSNY